jgi:hypothetical protein
MLFLTGSFGYIGGGRVGFAHINLMCKLRLLQILVPCSAAEEGSGAASLVLATRQIKKSIIRR